MPKPAGCSRSSTLSHYFNELPPKRASIVWDLNYEWKDSAWQKKAKRGSLQQPWSVYEVHAGSWKKSGDGEA
jgi:1,4-alpha-glucan branching enzyme